MRIRRREGKEEKNRNRGTVWLTLLLVLCLTLCGCGSSDESVNRGASAVAEEESTAAESGMSAPEETEAESEIPALEETEAQSETLVPEETETQSETLAPEETTKPEPESGTDGKAEAETTGNAQTKEESTVDGSVTAERTDVQDLDWSQIPDYEESPYVVVHDNIPYFSDSELTADSYEFYSDLDGLGRCGTAMASIGVDLMPTEERGEIGSVKPTGWHTVKYDTVNGKYLYNRCHLIAFELAGENANEKNLITGTRYFNVEGMLPFENMVTDYVKETENHVLYRVTPLFTGENLVADGALMEAESVEDRGEDICFCVYCYNVQPGIEIDYATGESWQVEEEAGEAAETEEIAEPAVLSGSGAEGTTYILNTNTKKFHDPSCSSVAKMSEKNKQEYTGTREEVIGMGYEPCGNCHP